MSDDSEKMRVTMHNGRLRSDGTAYSAKHNDRNFNIENAAHIDPKRTSENEVVLFNLDIDEGVKPTFEKHELNFYNRHFRTALDKKNENPLKHSQYARVKTMKQFMASPKTCPEETIMQIGDMEKSADRETLKSAFNDWVDWHEQMFPQAVFLDAAAHYDEDGSEHWHIRKVWIAHEDGIEIVSQNKALEEMGVAPPYPDKKIDRYNNRKATYTRVCRDKWIDICESYGIEIEKEPLETSQSGLTQLEYKRRREEDKLKQAQEEREQVKAELAKAKRDLKLTSLKVAGKTSEADKIIAAAQAKADETIAAANEYFKTHKKEAEEENNKLKAENEGLKAKITENQVICDKLGEMTSLFLELEKIHRVDESNPENERLKNYMRSIKYPDGTTVFDGYQAAEEQRKQKINAVYSRFNADDVDVNNRLAQSQAGDEYQR